MLIAGQAMRKGPRSAAPGPHSVLPPCSPEASQAARSFERVHARERLGALGEELASAHLQRLGFRVLERNVRTRGGEIDLIVFDGHTLVFVEVKTARAVPAGRRQEAVPLQWLGPRQRQRIRRLARAWLADPQRRHPRAAAVRFDAIGVVLDTRGRLQALEHLEGAW